MRISTQSLFETGAKQLGDLQSGLMKTQQQISTGRRILSPSDDPVGAARALEVSQSKSMNTQYGVNRQSAKGTLSVVEGTLSSVTSLYQDVQSTIVAAGNGTLSDAERGYQSTELRGRLNELMGLANARDAVGNYLFSGFKTDTPAFALTATGAQYQGDQGQHLMKVDASRQIAVTSPGQAVFQDGGQDVFKTLNDLIELLATPVVTPADKANLTAGLASANAGMDKALDTVLSVRAAMGARLQELDSLDNLGSERNIQYSQILSDLQDLDYAEALTQLSQQQVTLEAAQRTFVSTSNLSLFNFL